MMGVLNAHAAMYLNGLALLMLVGFGLPMGLWPLRWARTLGWRLPSDDTDLAVYFGRCLGCVVAAIAGCSLYVARTPDVQPFWFAFLLANSVLMIGVHAYGAVRRIQPLSETIEILFWAGLALLTLLFWPLA